jgi:DNA-binding MarR family transcriptional regulator
MAGKKARSARPSAALPEGELGEVLEFMRLVWGLAHRLETRSRLMERRLGVTGPQRLVIRIVGRFPSVSAGRLAAILQIHPSTLSGILKRLVARGLLHREADPVDARRVRLALTEAGRKLDAMTEGTVESVVHSTIASLPAAQIAAAREVLEALTRKMGAEDASPESAAPAKAKKTTAPADIAEAAPR